MILTIRKQRTYLNTPVKIGILLNIFTLSLFFWGPYSYSEKNEELLVFFLFMCNLMMYLGFAYGSHKNVTVNEYAEQFPMKKFLNVLYWVSIVTFIPKFIIYTGMYSYGFSGVISEIRRGFMNILTNANELYSFRLHYSINAPGIWKYVNYIIIITGPLYWAYMGLSMYYFKVLSRPKRIGTVLIWFLYLAGYIYSGTNAGLFHFFITLMAVVFSKYVKKTRKEKRKRSLNEIRKRRKSIIVIILIIILLLFLFSAIMGSRIGKVYVLGYNENSFFSKILPEPLWPLLSYITKYYAAPYTRLELAFDESFSPTFGVGHSWFLLDNMGPLSKDLWARTYPMKLNADYGIDYYACWHTAYMWFANDVSFYGVPIVLFILFSFFGKAWREYLECGNMLAFLVFLLCIRMMFFMSANNQIFQQPDTMMAFWALVVYRVAGKKWRWCDFEIKDNE